MAGFIAIFWTVRVMIDLVWYDHRDWPKGNALVAGHALATSLFIGLAVIYWVRHWRRQGECEVEETIPTFRQAWAGGLEKPANPRRSSDSLH